MTLVCKAFFPDRLYTGAWDIRQFRFKIFLTIYYSKFIKFLLPRIYLVLNNNHKCVQNNQSDVINFYTEYFLPLDRCL